MFVKVTRSGGRAYVVRGHEKLTPKVGYVTDNSKSWVDCQLAHSGSREAIVAQSHRSL